MTNVRKNMKAKAKAMSLWDRVMLSRRFIIETINDQLKNITHIELCAWFYAQYDAGPTSIN